MSRKTRQSLKPRQSGLPEAFGSLSLDGRQSLGRQSIGRQSTGRQSIYGRQSMTVKTIPKDPRPIRDKQWVSQGIKSLIASLVQLGYPNTLSPKQLQTPSQKEFFGIFKFLYSCLDPSHKFGERLEEELPFLLKSLKYPFAESINKSHLMSVASLQTWPVLLASLLWLVDLIMVFELDDMDEQEQAEKIYFEHLKNTYRYFLQGEDNFEDLDNELISKFDQKNEAIIQEVEQLKHQLELLDKEWHSLNESEPPLTVAERERTILQGDLSKYTAYVSHLESKLEKLTFSCQQLQQDCDRQEHETQELYKEKEQLLYQVETQELSPQDVDRMHAERDQLVQSIENQRQHLDDINKKVWQGEITLQKTMDRLEKNVSEFNSILYKLGMSQQELELLVNAKTPEQMTSLDLNQFKSECQCYIQDQKKAIRLIHDEILNLQEQTDTLQWNNQQRQEQIQVLEQSVENLNKRYQEDKTSLGKILSDAQTQFSEYTKQIESLKRESHLLLQQSQHRLTSKQLECDKQEDLLQLNKEKILQELVNGLVDVFGFHQKIQTSLDGLKEMLEE